MPTTTTVATLIGNPRPASRTAQIAAAVAAAVARGLDDAYVVAPVELGLHGAAVLAPESAEVGRDRDAVAAADVLVVASPTYKATYTGLLKSFFDRYDGRGLAGVTAVPLMVGASAEHALAVELHLRPVLVELGAVVAGRGLYVLDSQLDDLDAAVTAWWTANGPAIRAVALSGGAA
ncbi:NADPH-dependent FMN reductase [Pimelobacter simplex]|uniref:NADPH-dependent FMN reductase n=1 Tax=Nocardioides simplex TaxID=2045 RepID=UPI0019328106|nr:NAD(P)H-dependent oxidoreductase [Pimelobacter simplex]